MNKSSLLITLLTVLVLPAALAQPDKSITIHQEIDFNVNPQPLYEALLDAKQFTAFSGRPAEINREVGGAFSLFGGHIIGRNVELLPTSPCKRPKLNAITHGHVSREVCRTIDDSREIEDGPF